MKFSNRFGRAYRGNDGLVRVKTLNPSEVGSDIYRTLKEISQHCENASSKNCETELKEASHGLACVVAYRDQYQSKLDRADQEDAVLLAKLFIVCRFSNSIYAAMRLGCMGLILDGIACLRSAFEALQYGRLLSLKPDLSATFMDTERSLRPVEVRKQLELLGHDVALARERYSLLSTFSHIGGTGETFALEPIEGNVAFNIGGYVDPALQKRIIIECHRACGEFIAFMIGIRHENVAAYHGAIKAWIAEGIPQDEILRRIPTLVEKLR